MGINITSVQESVKRFLRRIRRNMRVYVQRLPMGALVFTARVLANYVIVQKYQFIRNLTLEDMNMRKRRRAEDIVIDKV
jgi:hypothetical protein